MVSHHEVRGGGGGVLEKRAGVHPFLEAKKARYQKYEAGGNPPNSKNYQYVQWIAKMRQCNTNVLDAQ